MEAWTDFFVATAGAAGVLAGLVIVAISVNVGEIIKYPQLPARAGAAIGVLILALVVSLVALAPQPLLAIGIEALAFGLVAWGLHVLSARITYRGNRERRRPLREAVQVILLGQLQTLPVLVGGVLVALRAPAGEYVLFAGILLIFPLAVFDAWVLLVEILR